MNGCARIVVFAKAPVAGPGEDAPGAGAGRAGAAALAERLLVHAVAQAAAAALRSAGAVRQRPTRRTRCFAGCSAEHRLVLSEQGDGDLGARMHRALAHALATQPRVRC